MIIELLFWISLLGTGYSYFIYPVILLIIRQLKKETPLPLERDPYDLPSLSFIITAYNEENQIRKKLENTLLCDYPAEKLEIIVASDGSTDQTNEIVESFSNDSVILHPVKERKGKENAQRSAIESANGDILVFSDVSTQIESTAFYQIAKRFSDPSIGAISSEDRFITQEGEVAGEGAYVKYEMWLRQLESNVNSLVGLSGSFFAARKDVCQNWSISVPSDFNTALNCIKNKYIAITAPELLGFYPNLKDESKEYQRKVRTVLRGMSALASQAFIMNPFRYGMFTFQVISHKLMRWLVPWFLVLTVFSNILIVNSISFYAITLFCQIVFYCIAVLGYVSAGARKISIIKICYFFIQVNLAIAQSTLMFLSGKTITTWEPSKR